MGWSLHLDSQSPIPRGRGAQVADGIAGGALVRGEAPFRQGKADWKGRKAGGVSESMGRSVKDGPLDALFLALELHEHVTRC